MRWRKYGEMAFLTSRNAIECVLGVLVSIIQSGTKAEIPGTVHVPHYMGLVSPSIARHQANAVELANQVC